MNFYYYGDCIVAVIKRIHFIPPLSPKRKSFTAQVSALTRLTAVNPKWLLIDDISMKGVIYV